MKAHGYESLADVLQRAYNQAATGKGAERHACDRPFTEQPMQSISQLLGSHTGLLYQAMKKIQESQRMDNDAAIRELLGAINYIAGAIIFKESKACQDINEAAMKANITTVIGNEPLPGAPNNDHWVCFHGHGINDYSCERAERVPVGEACPTCFALK